jgi:hypothetical protein
LGSKDRYFFENKSYLCFAIPFFKKIKPRFIMKNQIFILFILFFCLSANAQKNDKPVWRHSISVDAEQKYKPVWQHSLSANVQTYTFDPYLWGLRYDARLRTPHEWTDWAFGASSAYGRNAYEWSFSDKNKDAYYKNSSQLVSFLNLHAYCLFGRKNLVVQTGLDIGFHERQFENTSTVTTHTTSVPVSTNVNNFNGRTDILTLIAPLGLRYQSPRNGITIWADGGVGFYLETHNPNNLFGKPLFYSPYKLQAGIGYSFGQRK